MVLFLFIVIVLALVLAGVYFIFLRRTAGDGAGWRTVALIGLAAGILAIGMTALAAVLSATTLLDDLSFRDLLGMFAFLGIPVALVGLGCSALGLKSEARSAAVTGLALSVVSLAAWIVMEITLGG